MRERDKHYWVVPNNRMFKLLLKHDRVDAENISFI